MMGFREIRARLAREIMMVSGLTRALVREIMMGSGLSIIISPHRLIIQVVQVQDLNTQCAGMMESLSQGMGPFGLNDEKVH